MVYTGGEQVSIVNSTIYGQGDGLVGGGPREGFQCDGSETLTGLNNVFLGDEDFFDSGDITFIFYTEGCSDLTFEGDYSIAYNVKNIEAPYVSPLYPSDHNLLEDPMLAGPFSGDAYGMTLTSGSPAIDAGTSSDAPPDDFDGLTRDSTPDMGAYEMGGGR